MIALIIQGYDKEKRKDRALELIDKVGLTSHIHHKASKLSGGQKQRCVIARALAKDCPIIVADEPTGNLDSESGEKIMSLLQEISKDKLVIVVTHNYDQVKQYATRKIRLFDGEVVEDKAIKKAKKVTEEIIIPSFTMSFFDLIGISLRNLFRTPRRTIFTTLISVFTAIVLIFAYATYVDIKTDTGNYYGSGAFRNVTESRIIVTKFDGTPFTQVEIDAIENLRLVRTIMEHDVILDSTINAYLGEYGYNYGTPFFINPADMLESNQLKDGELPSSIYEVVIEEIEGFGVGDKITLGYIDYMREENIGTPTSEGIEFTISGIAKDAIPGAYPGRMYFHEDYINSDEVYLEAYVGGNYWSPYVSVGLLYNNISAVHSYDWPMKIDESIPDGEIHVLDELVTELLISVDENPQTGNITDLAGYTFQLYGLSAFETKSTDVSITGVYQMEEEDWTIIAVNSNTLKAFMPSDIYQLGVLVFDDYDAEKVIKEIDKLGYNTIYPDSIVDAESAIGAIFTTIIFGFILGFLVLVIYFISYVVLKNIQVSKKKDYLIIRSIGASKKDLNRVTIIELVTTALIAYVFTMTLLVINESFDSFMPKFSRFFTFSSYVFILFLLVFLSVLLGRRFNNRIFSRSVITSLKQE